MELGIEVEAAKKIFAGWPRRMIESSFSHPISLAVTNASRAGARRADLDLYVQRRGAVNAYAAGRHSIALTSGVLREFLARRLDAAELEAMLVHELGHHATRSTHLTLVATWLALPWRVASRLVVGALRVAGRRQPVGLLPVVVVIVVVAIMQLVQDRQDAAAALLAGVGVCTVTCPLADAWVSRRSEYAADRFAAERGAAPQLISALHRLDRSAATAAYPSWRQRMFTDHPSLDRRCMALMRYTADQRQPVVGERDSGCLQHLP